LRNQQTLDASNCAAAIAIQYEYDKMTRPEDFTGDESIVSLDTRFLPIRLTLFPVAPLSLELVTTYVRQTGNLLAFVGADSIPVDQRCDRKERQANGQESRIEADDTFVS